MKNKSKTIRFAAATVLVVLSLAGATGASAAPSALAKPANGHVWCC